jgi:hypothetical protein
VFGSKSSTSQDGAIVPLAPAEGLTIGELVLLYPIERGFGLHPDLQRLHLAVTITGAPREERYFLLRSAYLPLL